MHLTESCDDDLPHLLTDVLTTPATTSDFEVTPTIQASLVARDLRPGEHIVDGGYITADHLVSSQQDYDIDLLGPVPQDHSWQAKADEGFAAAQFVIQWNTRTATCPQGKTSVSWLPRQDHHDHATIQIKFAPADCRECPQRARCTHSAMLPRLLIIRKQDQYEALQAARKRQTTASFKAQYNRRAGVEGTISQGTRAGDLRRARYVGLVKTNLHHLLLATGINLLRVCNWLACRCSPVTHPSFCFCQAGLSCT